MNYTVIDSKTESHSYGFWKASENVKTTISLLNMGGGKVGLSYSASYSGLETGTVQGGPFEVDGDETKKVHDSPEVDVVISQYEKGENHVSTHVAITVDIPVIGKQTIYSETLAGNYSVTTGWEALFAELDALAKK